VYKDYTILRLLLATGRQQLGVGTYSRTASVGSATTFMSIDPSVEYKLPSGCADEIASFIVVGTALPGDLLSAELDPTPSTFPGALRPKNLSIV